MAHHKIALLADTHGLLREEVVQKIKDCEVIFHAGDFGGPEIVERLQQIAPVYMARGNNDKGWAKEMPYFVRERIGNRTFYMCHKKQDLPDDLGKVDFVICGHSHKYELKQEGSICYINPGSCGRDVFTSLLRLQSCILRMKRQITEWKRSIFPLH